MFEENNRGSVLFIIGCLLDARKLYFFSSGPQRSIYSFEHEWVANRPFLRYRKLEDLLKQSHFVKAEFVTYGE